MQRKLLIMAGLLICILTNAQTEKKTRLGFLLSPQISWMSSDANSVNSNGSLFGYNFGVLVDRFFDTNYAFSTGLTINTGGGKLSYDATSELEKLNATYRLKYIEVPLSLKLLTNEFHRSRYFGQFGLYSQFNIKASDIDGNNISSNVNFFDMGYQLGGGMEYSLGGNTFLTVGLIYYGGFLDVTDFRVTDKSNLKRFVFQFGVIF
ncbi:porin family protein [Carboxylicivirga caseinilyticus]|uniref:porin family protein n=1 Tax=Carboxylicivirga caseinilyticus TaxID=3417572 RepID=UPI003D348DD1|nr:PorT family protein [Marinilabiliaceae bacterium A049]